MAYRAAAPIDYDYEEENFEEQLLDMDAEEEEFGGEDEDERHVQAQAHEGHPEDSDSDDDMMDTVTDTSAAQVRQGKDIQGIPWDRLHFTRARYRETRLQQYKNYENVPNIPHDDLMKVCKDVDKSGDFFSFRYNTRSVRSTIVHFQLRNLVWATSKHDVYVMHHHAIQHWSAVSRRASETLNLIGGPGTMPAKPERGERLYSGPGGWRVSISTMCARDNLLVIGGFNGEMVCKRLDRPGLAYSARITQDENAITNAIDIIDTPSGALRIMSSNNDSIVRLFDGETFQVLNKFNYQWAVNHTSMSHDGKLMAVVGDNPAALLADSQSGKVVAELHGHHDFSFASHWHPDGRLVVTGNQDTTARVWDIRYLGRTALAVLKGRIGAIRALRFTSDGRFLAMSEPADFVHVFDVHSNFSRCQEIDLFGEVAGISFSPDGEALYIGVADRTYGSLLEFNRRTDKTYEDFWA